MNKTLFFIFILVFLTIFGVTEITLLVQAQTSKKIVVLDPGHCSNDKYKENKVPENTLNMMQAIALADLLDKNGYDARIYNPNGNGSCSEDDYYQNLQSRVDYANSLSASLYISIHADSGEQNDKFNPIYSQNGPYSEESLRFANEIGRAVVQALTAQSKNVSFEVTESRSTGVAQGNGLEYYVLGPKGSKTAKMYGGKVEEIINERSMPGIIMENYMKTTNDYKTIYPYIGTIAKGYCNGIAKFLDGKDCQGEATSTNITSLQSLGIAACKFYRPDQTPGSGNCPPETEGTDRCAPGLSFKSPLLVSYIEEASKITGVPAPILAGVVRIESTVPQKYSLTGKSYSISDYTDEDIKAMEEFSKTADGNNIDSTIGSTNKALCPHSTTGALGITQIQPYGTTGNNSPDGKNASVEKAAEYLAKATGIQKTNTTLSYQEYCNPRYSIILSGGFILGKLGKDEDPWKQPPTQDAYKEKVLRIARLYYGEDDQLEVYRQGLWQGVDECKAGSPATNFSGSSQSNKVCVKVGNPTEPAPIGCSFSSSALTPTGAPSVEAEKLAETINKEFRVSMQGPWSEQGLKWVYEAFYKWKQTNPKFIDLVRGQPVIWIPDPAGSNAYENIAKASDRFSDGEKFLGTLVHEMSHVIYHLKDPKENLKLEQAKIFSNQGAVTSYGKTGPADTENYPEMISYCLTKRPVGALTSVSLWENSYKPLVEQIVGPCL